MQSPCGNSCQRALAHFNDFPRTSKCKLIFRVNTSSSLKKTDIRAGEMAVMNSRENIQEKILVSSKLSPDGTDVAADHLPTRQIIFKPIFHGNACLERSDLTKYSGVDQGQVTCCRIARTSVRNILLFLVEESMFLNNFSANY